MEIILRGRLYTAREALTLGLVHQIVPPDNLETVAEEFLKPIFKNPQYALSKAKQAVQASQNLPMAEGLQVERNKFKECFGMDYFVPEIKRQIASGQMPTTSDPAAGLAAED